ncbi:MAG: T9SS type A sorting domain-containing protein [Saprospiraceae bacterium]|nr:T9SS type A sorting domain-containing protein [Saprospiraceae bacterium]
MVAFIAYWWPRGAVAISNVLAQNFPLYDQAFILTNSPYYGGSGGTNPVASTESSSSEIAIHELGHSFVHLADEYWAGDAYAGEAINMSQQTDPALIKWKNWYNIEGIGIYQHCCGGVSAMWYRPHQNCKMRALGNPFCAICREAIIEKIHALIDPIEQFSPSDQSIIATIDPIEFKLNLLAPTPNTLKVKWILNGNTLVMPNTANFILDVNNLISGTNTLSAIVEDTTQFLRVDGHSTLHFYIVSWAIQKMLTGIEDIEASRDKIEISTYPNPTTDLLNIQIKNEKAAFIKIELYDIKGALIKSTPYNKMANGVNQFQLDLKNQATGAYFVKIIVNDMPFTLKIFKAK